MLRELFKLWPALIPFMLYFGWLAWTRRQAAAKGEPLTRFTDGPWVVTLIATLIIAAACFIAWGSSFDATGDYHPPYLENGQIIEGYTDPKVADPQKAKP